MTESRYRSPYQGPAGSRVGKMSVRGIDLLTPAYVPAFSSAKDDDFAQRMKSILDERFPMRAFLVSAYDLSHELRNAESSDLVGHVAHFASDHVLILDNGSYEIGREMGNEWGMEDVVRTAIATKSHIIVAFDRIPDRDEELHLDQRLISELEMVKMNVSEAIPREDVALTYVLHSNRATSPLPQLDAIASVIAENSEWVDILGFPDVEMGPDIVSRVRFARELRTSLTRMGLDTPIHVLGCSEPLSMVLYALAGVDLFDGNGWWDRTIDTSDLSYHDVSYLPLMSCQCTVCRKCDWDEMTPSEYGRAVMLHNLLQYDRLMGEVRSSILQHSFDGFVVRSTLGEFVQRLVKGMTQEAQ